jgi:hypothetical protein
MEPVMNDVSDVAARKGPGNIVIGVMLVLTGFAVVLDRSGVLHWSRQWTLWPLVLGGIGLANFLQSPPGRPRRGLLFLTLAVWLFISEAGLITLADSWPIVVIAVGVMVALNGGTRRRWPQPPVVAEGPEGSTPVQRARRRHRRSLSPLAIVGTWIAIVIALQVSGVRTLSDTSAGDRERVFSLMARTEHISRSTAFQGADVTNVMGRSELDLHDATMAGTSATVNVFSAMGEVIVRVPRGWTVDAGAITAIGGVRDDRGTPPEAEATTGSMPRLVLRGLVLFGRLTISS